MTKADRAKMKALEDSHKKLMHRLNDTKQQWQNASVLAVRSKDVANWISKQVETQEAELQTSFDTIQEIRRSIANKDAAKRNEIRQWIKREEHPGRLRSLEKQLRDLGGDV